MADRPGHDRSPLRQGPAAAGPEDGACDAGRNHTAKNRLIRPKTQDLAVCQLRNCSSRRWTFAPLSDTSARLRYKGSAFRQPFALSEFQFDPSKEDAACRFSSAIITSIKPSRR